MWMISLLLMSLRTTLNTLFRITLLMIFIINGEEQIHPKDWQSSGNLPNNPLTVDFVVGEPNICTKMLVFLSLLTEDLKICLHPHPSRVEVPSNVGAKNASLDLFFCNSYPSILGGIRISGGENKSTTR